MIHAREDMRSLAVRGAYSHQNGSIPPRPSADNYER
ncbi:hypothetical protein ACVIW2_009330 [Bradyrhizobium huanghuaihaiense]